MKFHPLLLIIFLAIPSFGAATVTTSPSIQTQPVANLTADYGSDASFSVAVTGDPPLSFQWTKNGLPLADYENISGAETETLSIIGIAGNDSANYTVIVSNAAGAITSSVATLSINPATIFSDDFESGFGNWKPLNDSTPLFPSSAQNHSPGGSISASMTNSSQKSFYNLPTSYACRVIYSFWMYDDGGSISCGGELRGYTSDRGYAKYHRPGGLAQSFGAGRSSNPFLANTGVLTNEALNVNFYQAFILKGINAGWFNLNAPGAPSRSIGWHKFTIDRPANGTGRIIRFYIDDILARTISGVDGYAVNSIMLGAFDASGTNSAAAGNAFFDDISVETFPGLFDWQELASDGPIFDWMKARETGAKASVNFIDTIANVSTVNGANTNGSSGQWQTDGAGIIGHNMRGRLTYAVTAPADNAYRIEIEGRENNFQWPEKPQPLAVSIDGEFLADANLHYMQTADGTAHCFTPFLKSGNHSIDILWDGVSPRQSLRIDAVRLQALYSHDMKSREMTTWVANRLAAQNGVEIAPATSFVSPVCVEGRGQFLSMMTLTAGSGGNTFPVPVHPGTGNRFYANVPLTPNAVTEMEASFQSGGLKETNEITWEPLNLLAVTNTITIRQGDSLLFTALPNANSDGAVTVNINNTTTLTGDTQTPVPYQFHQPGTNFVTGMYVPTGAGGGLTVIVVGASFDAPIIAHTYRARFWTPTNLPPGVVLDIDPRLKMNPATAEDRSRQIPALPPKGQHERDFWIRTRYTQPEFILARLGHGGPILASVPVEGYRWNIAPDTYLSQVAVNDDGSQVIETAFVASPYRSELSVAVQIIVAGVTFDDGTVTKTLGQADFDDLGICRLRFLRAAGVQSSVCHTTHIYQGNILTAVQ